MATVQKHPSAYLFPVVKENFKNQIHVLVSTYLRKLISTVKEEIHQKPKALIILMISSTSIKISPTYFAMIKFRTHIQGKLNFTGIIFNILETFSKTSCHTLQVMTFVCLRIIIRILIHSQIGTQLLLA